MGFIVYFYTIINKQIMNKKQHLIDSLKLAIQSLEADVIKYSWSEQTSCNAGVVSQAVLGLSKDEFEKLRKPAFDKLEDINEGLARGSRIDLTWKNAIKHTCPITGKDMPQVFQDLENAGLSRFDIAHLEYMDNSAILAESTIEKVKTQKGEKVIGQRQEEYVETSWFGLVKKTKTKTVDITEPVYVERYPLDYYRKKENLIKYLSAWVRILEREGVTYNESDRESLEASLIVAVAEDNFEKAAEIRDLIAKSF